MDRTEAMRIFVSVAELASFTGAAQVLNLPKSTITAGVQQLEQTLAVRLLQRTTRRVHLTQEGQVCLKRCQEILAAHVELDNLFRQEQELTGRLRVDLSIGMAVNMVVPRLPEFLERHPHLVLELGSTDRQVDLIQEGYDCVVRVGALPESGVIARKLGYFEVVTCASPAYLARFGTPQTPADLVGHRLVHYVQHLGKGTCAFDWRDPVDGSYHEMPLRGALTVNNSGAYLAACLAGLGLIQVPTYGVRAELDAGLLVEILADFRPEPMPVTLLFPDRHLPKRVQVFGAWLEGIIQPQLQDGHYSPRARAAAPSLPLASPCWAGWMGGTSVVPKV